MFIFVVEEEKFAILNVSYLFLAKKIKGFRVFTKKKTIINFEKGWLLVLLNYLMKIKWKLHPLEQIRLF